MKNYSLLVLLFLTVCFDAQAALPQKRVLVSVGDIQDNKNKEWKKKTCLQVYTIANQISENGTNVTCREFSTERFLDQDLDKLSASFDYHLRITKNQDSSLSMDITNWKRKHESDFKSVGWDFKDSKNSKVTKEEAMAKVLGNVFFFADNEKAYKGALLANGAFESSQVAYNEKQQIFIDKVTNTPVTVDQAITLFENESPRKKNYLRAGIEIGVQLSAAMAIYWKNQVFNQQDFDYSLGGGLKGKFITGDAILFDDNNKSTNYTHTYAGVMYYQTARSNGFNSLESALIGFASSTAWELLEYHEVLSINDQILTPVGGYVIGEAAYQLSCALLAKNSFAAKAIGYTINPALAFNHAYDKKFKGDKFAGQSDCKKPRWSDISLHVGLEKGQKSYEPSKNTDMFFGMDATIVNIENYDKEGKDGKMVYDTAMTKMLVEANGNQGLIDLRIVAQVVMAAYHEKNISRDKKGQLRGYDLLFGVGSGSTWHDSGDLEKQPNEDFYGTVNILGATAHANIHYNGFNIRADFGLYGDFAMVKSYSLEKLKAQNDGDISNESSIIQKRGYYWGYGASAIASISISKGRFEVGYWGQHSTASSINERNRIDATSGSVFSDTMHINRVYVRYSLTKNLKLQLSHEVNARSGSVNGGLKATGVERRTMGTLIYKF